MNDEPIRRSLEAVIREDGRGEIRDQDSADPLQAGDADELRALVIQRTMALADEAGGPVRLRTIDVDGVYPLIVFPDGDIGEEGPVEPLRGGEHDLRSDAIAAAGGPDAADAEAPAAGGADGGYAQQYGGPTPAPVSPPQVESSTRPSRCRASA